MKTKIESVKGNSKNRAVKQGERVSGKIRLKLPAGILPLLKDAAQKEGITFPEFVERAVRHKLDEPHGLATLQRKWFDLACPLESGVTKAIALIDAMDDALCAASRNSDDTILKRDANGLSLIGVDIANGLQRAIDNLRYFHKSFAEGMEEIRGAI